MIIEVILRLMMLTTSMLLMNGVAVSFSVCRVLWEDGKLLAFVATVLLTILILLLAVLTLAIALFADFC